MPQSSKEYGANVTQKEINLRSLAGEMAKKGVSTSTAKSPRSPKGRKPKFPAGTTGKRDGKNYVITTTGKV